jgi:hypothetical protein
MEEYQMGRAYGMYGREEKFIQGFGGETPKERVYL